MGWYQYAPYVPVAKRREEAAKKVEKLKKQGKQISPVKIEGKTIAKSFWGKSWCENLESYSDYENRLPRGRTYVRNGSVCDLQVFSGEVKAMVVGSEMYTISVKITPVANATWTSICGDCAGSVGSLVELLQGKLSKSVMERVCRKGDGLFPAPHEIKLSCSCPDWADMCKHVAAAMYGIGARLDEKPELLFHLRNVNENELIAKASAKLPMADAAPKTARVMEGDDISALFGIEMGGNEAEAKSPEKPLRSAKPKPKPKPASKPVAESTHNLRADRKKQIQKSTISRPAKRITVKVTKAASKEIYGAPIAKDGSPSANMKKAQKVNKKTAKSSTPAKKSASKRLSVISRKSRSK